MTRLPAAITRQAAQQHLAVAAPQRFEHREQAEPGQHGHALLLRHRPREVGRPAQAPAQFADIGRQHRQHRRDPAQRSAAADPRRLDGVAGPGQQQHVGDPVGQLVPDRSGGPAPTVLDRHHPVEQVAQQPRLDADGRRHQHRRARQPALQPARRHQQRPAQGGEGDAGRRDGVGTDLGPGQAFGHPQGEDGVANLQRAAAVQVPSHATFPVMRRSSKSRTRL